MVEYRQTDPIDLLKSSMDDKKLHRHQNVALEHMDNYFDLSLADGEAQNGLLIMPTGSGKTFTAVNWLLDRCVSRGYKVLWLVHRQELIDQANETFRKQAPLLAQYGIKKTKIIPISGGHFSMSQASGFTINICSIGSIASKNGLRYIKRLLGTNGKEKLIVVIDEAHHAVSPSYKKVIHRITEINPQRILLGLTATPYRMQESEHYQLLRQFNVHENINKQIGTDKGYIYEVTLKELLLLGFLAEPIYKRIETCINAEVEFEFTPEDSAFFEKFGELSEHLKEQIAKSSSRNEIIVNEYIKNRSKYRKTLVFAVNRLHCITLAKAFNDAGVSCKFCMSGEPDVDQTIKAFKANEFDVLINVQILTEGSDVPDIQTIFLTRQTNSDSLLMQMIGRGLRGIDAGGTKNVYVVDFHDTWDKFNFWLDPKQLIVDEFGHIEEVCESCSLVDETMVCDEKTLDVFDPIITEEQINIWDVYLRLYSTMKANLLGVSHREIFPCGWYSVVTEDGQDTKILVYDDQRPYYEILESNSNVILKTKSAAQKILNDYFDLQENRPAVEEIQLILDHLYELNEMPTYYSFRQREEVDAKLIAKKMVAQDLRPSEFEYKLKDIYDKNAIVKELYKSFYLFKQSVRVYKDRLEDGDPIESEVITLDERDDFIIIEGHHDLIKLYNEVLRDWFDSSINPEIRWSRKPLRSRFGSCIQNADGSIVIVINKLFMLSKC